MGLDAEAIVVSTHSRLKAAGEGEELPESDFEVSTHSRLKAAGVVAPIKVSKPLVSTHSRLKAAGVWTLPKTFSTAFQHTAA